MGEREIAVRSVVAGSLWLAGIVLVAIGALTPHEVGQCGLLCTGAAMVITVRGYFARFEEREREAFQLGRDYEHGQTRLRSLN